MDSQGKMNAKGGISSAGQAPVGGGGLGEENFKILSGYLKDN